MNNSYYCRYYGFLQSDTIIIMFLIIIIEESQLYLLSHLISSLIVENTKPTQKIEYFDNLQRMFLHRYIRCLFECGPKDGYVYDEGYGDVHQQIPLSRECR